MSDTVLYEHSCGPIKTAPSKAGGQADDGADTGPVGLGLWLLPLTLAGLGLWGLIFYAIFW